jgi:hydroxymethylglutaryl-CoA lyase
MATVRIVEVGPRDGLQNIAGILPTSTKVKLIQRLAQSGLSIIEATSFVSPKWIPQLADGPQVLQRIKPLIESNAQAIQFPVLVPNIKGLDLAHQNGAREIAVFVSATEGFSKKNINCSVDESLVRVQKVAERARVLGLKMRGHAIHSFWRYQLY